MSNCSLKSCTLPVYMESKCYRHFITEDRDKDSEGRKADGSANHAERAVEQVLAAPKGTQAEKVKDK